MIKKNLLFINSSCVKGWGSIPVNLHKQKSRYNISVLQSYNGNFCYLVSLQKVLEEVQKTGTSVPVCVNNASKT